MNSRTISLRSSMPRSPISTMFAGVKFLWNSYILCFQLPLPAMRGSIVSRSIGCESQCVSRLMWPTLARVRSAIGLGSARAPPRPRGDRLGDRVRAARRVLADHDRQRAGIEHLVDLLLDGGLRPQDVV